MRVSLLLLLLIAPGGSPPHSRPHPGLRATMMARRIGDAEILGTIGTFDANGSEAAKLGSTKAHTQEVRAYAKMLLADHQRSQQTGLRLAKLLRIAPVLPSDSSITRAHKAEMDQLNLISAAEFDKAFVQYMVVDHKMMIARIDSVLLPAAAHAQLKTFMRNLRPSLAMHEAKGQEWLDKQKP
jgi:predicted outer membrane protein